MPLNLEDDTGELFLDTIPEDVSVTAKSPRRVAKLSASSVVASSDGGVSDTPALLGGNEEDNNHSNHLPGGITNDTTTTHDHQRKRRKKRKRKKQSKGRKRNLTLFYAIVFGLLIGVAIGIYFIIMATVNNDNNNNSSGDISSEEEDKLNQPSTDPATAAPSVVFFDFDNNDDDDVSQENNADNNGTNNNNNPPTESPSYNMDDVQATNEAIESMYDNDADLIYDLSQPQGKCRFWLTHQDTLELRVNQVGKERIRQRYLSCLLFHSTNGNNWQLPNNTIYMDNYSDECDWYGLTCNNEDQIALLDFPQINLIGTLPTELVYLQQLKYIILSGNTLSGEIPSGLLDLPELIWVDLSDNQLEGTIPPNSVNQISLTSPLQVLYLNNNLFNGMIPWFPSLERLWVYENEFSSFDEMYSLDATATTTTTSSPLPLRSLRAYSNQFNGELNQQLNWNNLPNLVEVSMGSNNWRGSIPKSIWELTSLEILLLNDCLLTGQLPTDSGSNTNLQNLWLQSNQLDGEIPETFGLNWRNISSLLLTDNAFSGSISVEQCDAWTTNDSLLDRRIEVNCEVACPCRTVEC